MNWRWISKQALMLLHGESLATHGGREGMRDEGLLESALMRPQNTVAYADADNPPDAAALAAGYGVGIAKNHPFVDGNKRAAFLARPRLPSPCSPSPQATCQKKSLPRGCARTLRRGHELI